MKTNFSKMEIILGFGIAVVIFATILSCSRKEEITVDEPVQETESIADFILGEDDDAELAITPVESMTNDVEVSTNTVEVAGIETNLVMEVEEVITNYPDVFEKFEILYPEYREFYEFKFDDRVDSDMTNSTPTEIFNKLLDRKFKRFDNKVIDASLEMKSNERAVQCSGIDFNGEYYLGIVKKKLYVVPVLMKFTPGIGIMESEDLSRKMAAMDESFTNHWMVSICRFQNKWAMASEAGMYILNDSLDKLERHPFPEYFHPFWDGLSVFDGDIYCRGLIHDPNRNINYFVLLRMRDNYETFQIVRMTSKCILRDLVVGNAMILLEESPNDNHRTKLIVFSGDTFYDMEYEFWGGRNAICYNCDEKVFFVFGTDNVVYFSNDLIHWESRTARFHRPIRSVINLEYLNGVYVMGTQYEIVHKDVTRGRYYNSWVYYSLDGVIWEEMRTPGSGCGYSIVKKIGDRIFFGAIEDTTTNLLFSTNIRSTYDKGLSQTYADKYIVSRHIDNDEIHVTRVEKDRINSTNHFDGRYSSLIGVPKKIESLSQLINDSGFITMDDVRLAMTREREGHPTYTRDDVDMLIRKQVSEIYNEMNSRLTLPRSDNNNLRFFLILDKGALRWVSEEDVREFDNQLH